MADVKLNEPLDSVDMKQENFKLHQNEQKQYPQSHEGRQIIKTLLDFVA